MVLSPTRLGFRRATLSRESGEGEQSSLLLNRRRVGQARFIDRRSKVDKNVEYSEKRFPSTHHLSNANKHTPSSPTSRGNPPLSAEGTFLILRSLTLTRRVGQARFIDRRSKIDKNVEHSEKRFALTHYSTDAFGWSHRWSDDQQGN